MRCAHRLGHARRRRFLDHLLVAALQRAVALEQMHDVAVACRRTPAPRCGAGASRYFSISTRSSPNADCASRWAPASAAAKSSAPLDQAHALAAAAGHRLDQHRIADLSAASCGQPLGDLVVAVIAGHHRHAGLRHQRLGRVLRAHGADRRGRRPDEDQARRRAGLGEVGVLGQEAIAGMDRLGAGRSRRRDDRVDVADSFRAPAAGRCAPPRRPRAHAARRRRHRNRPRPSRSPGAAPCG